MKLWIFLGVTATVAVAGLLLALWADPSGGNRDAWREVGGAIVSGAVLAGLVVWFEDSREDERDDRANERADETDRRAEVRASATARRAWRRELELRLMSVVHNDLSGARQAWLSDLAEGTKEQSRLVPLLAARGRPMSNTLAEVRTLLRFLRDNGLDEAWSDWEKACDTLESEVGPPLPMADEPEHESFGDSASLGFPEPGEIDRFARIASQHVSMPPLFEKVGPSRDPEQHEHYAKVEEEAWTRFLQALATYIDDRYPTGDLSKDGTV